MVGTNGIETARQVRFQDDSVTILFVTNIAQYAINAFEVEAVDHYLTYHLQGKSFGAVDLEVRDNMKNHEALLKPYNFCRVHNSYLVNLARIRLIRTNDLLIGDSVIPIGRSYKNELKKEYLRFVRG